MASASTQRCWWQAYCTRRWKHASRLSTRHVLAIVCMVSDIGRGAAPSGLMPWWAYVLVMITMRFTLFLVAVHLACKNSNSSTRARGVAARAGGCLARRRLPRAQCVLFSAQARAGSCRARTVQCVLFAAYVRPARARRVCARHCEFRPKPPFSHYFRTTVQRS